MSVSPPSSVTKTSPWIRGFMVPASTLRYGSIFAQVVLNPERRSNLAIDAVVTPFPKPDITPPVTKIYLGT